MGSFDESTVPVYMHSAEDGAHHQERFRVFCDAVRQLPLQCRRAFILKKVYGLSRREIADYMGITESTVQKHVAKGLMLCMEYLQSTKTAEDFELGRNGVRGKRREKQR
jgi:RNA polymerase sigma-70 factor (ECF subfamily)